jgi:hypothetical protein
MPILETKRIANMLKTLPVVDRMNDSKLDQVTVFTDETESQSELDEEYDGTRPKQINDDLEDDE